MRLYSGFGNEGNVDVVLLYTKAAHCSLWLAVLSGCSTGKASGDVSVYACVCVFEWGSRRA